MNIAILGSTGMIGSASTFYLSSLGHSVIEVNRKGVSITGENEVRKFDVLNNSVNELLNSLPSDVIVINLIGVIRHKIELDSKESLSQAQNVNSVFPKILVNEANKLNLQIIQIATDCVFSGESGAYSEDSKMDPIDIYGETKAAGEMVASNLLTLRVSIVGREVKNHVELMDWVLSQSANNVVNGYNNHFWNGITSLHFAKILDGILKNGLNTFGTYHLIPTGFVNKLELVQMIANLAERNDLEIMETAAEKPIDRTLRTNYIEINAEFWKSAGYQVIPTIRMMLEEYFGWIKPIDQGE
jgi:dTDP-4-dehydrorhamnose reductase